MRIILLGPPGSGKGTQSSFISGYFKISHLSTGDILRSEVNKGTDLGISAKKYMEVGDLIPDELMIEAIKNKILNLSTGFLLDGFPRTLNQAQSLDSLLIDNNKPIDKVVCLKVNKDEIISRLLSRAICNSCGNNYNLLSSPPLQEGKCDSCGGEIITRSDDNKEAISNRLQIYEEMTSPVINYYDYDKKCFFVSASHKPKSVFETIRKLLDK